MIRGASIWRTSPGIREPSFPHPETSSTNNMKKSATVYLAAFGALAVVLTTSALGADITINKTDTQQNLWGIGGFFGDKVATTLLTYSSAKQIEICDLLFKNSG